MGRYDPTINDILKDIDQFNVAYASKIHFEAAERANYAFDPADSRYGNNLIYSTHYNKLTNYNEYKLRWKFMQVGGSPNEVVATLPSGITADKEHLKFIIPQNNTVLEYSALGNDKVTLTLLPPPTLGEYSVLAVVKTSENGVDKWHLAGRLDLLAREHKTYNVTLVPLADGKAIDDTKKAEVREYLNSTWRPYGISWEKAPYTGQIGDNPLNQQWGYLFVNEFGEEADKQNHYRTLSHELGHVQ